MRATSVDRSKKEHQTEREFAKGGKTHMLKKQSAGPDRPGNTGKDQSAAPGARAAKGGPPTRGVSLSTPAKGGHTAPLRKGR